MSSSFLGFAAPRLVSLVTDWHFANADQEDPAAVEVEANPQRCLHQGNHLATNSGAPALT